MREFPLLTPVDVPELVPRMKVGDRTVLLGSCFAERVGERFVAARLPAVVNPLGVLFNPASIALAIESALTTSYLDDPLVEVDGVWYSWLASSVVSGKSEAECRAALTAALTRLGDGLRRARRLIITLGTPRCYRHAGRVVANCHRVPQREFEEVELGVNEIVAVLGHALDRLFAVNPEVTVVMTVSPYRYRKYGLHGSQLGKAKLLLAVDRLPRVTYFPAYEIVMDELRDYRFYADDMLHPSPLAVDYIWHRLAESWMDEPMQEYLREAERQSRREAHIPVGSRAGRTGLL